MKERETPHKSQRSFCPPRPDASFVSPPEGSNATQSLVISRLFRGELLQIFEAISRARFASRPDEALMFVPLISTAPSTRF